MKSNATNLHAATDAEQNQIFTAEKDSSDA